MEVESNDGSDYALVHNMYALMRGELLFTPLTLLSARLTLCLIQNTSWRSLTLVLIDLSDRKLLDSSHPISKSLIESCNPTLHKIETSSVSSTEDLWPERVNLIYTCNSVLSNTTFLPLCRSSQLPSNSPLVKSRNSPYHGSPTARNCQQKLPHQPSNPSTDPSSLNLNPTSQPSLIPPSFLHQVLNVIPTTSSSPQPICS